MPASRERVENAFQQLEDRRQVFAIVQFYGSRHPERGYTAATVFSDKVPDQHAHNHAEARLEENLQNVIRNWNDQNFHDYPDNITRVDITIKYSPCSYCVLKLLTIMLTVGRGVPLYVYYLDVYRSDPAGLDNLAGTVGVTTELYSNTPEGLWWGNGGAWTYGAWM